MRVKGRIDITQCITNPLYPKEVISILDHQYDIEWSKLTEGNMSISFIDRKGQKCRRIGLTSSSLICEGIFTKNEIHMSKNIYKYHNIIG